MNLTIAYQTNENQLLVRTLIPGEDPKNTTIDLHELSNKPMCFNLLLSAIEDSQAIDQFEMLKANPEKLHLSQELIENIVYDDAKNLITQIKDETCIRENLQTIENMTEKAQTLSNIYQNNREVYAFQIWKTIFENLSAYHLKIIFQSIDSTDSKTLVSKTVETSTFDEIRESTEEESLLFQDLSSEFGPTLHIPSYNKTNNQLTMTSTIGATKIIIMANVWHFTLLQKSIVQGLFNSVGKLLKS